MENSVKSIGEQKLKDVGSEDRMVKISLAHHKMLKEELLNVNSDKRFRKQIGVRRFIEKLIESCREDVVSDLVMEREGSEDFLKSEHARLAPDIPFWDWVRSHVAGSNRPAAKQSRKNSQGNAKENGGGVNV